MMPRRKFELPSIRDLTKEQERVRSLPIQGQHLVVGGPGTGKSVLALMRAKRLADEGLDYKFLVYNHLLNQANRKLFHGHLRSQTWMSWFLGRFKSITGQAAPRLPVEDPDAFAGIDWAKIETIADKPWNLNDLPSLVIDEGQDMPPAFYMTLVEFGFDNFFVVADQNQQITDVNSSRQQIEDQLAIETNDVIELRHNFRNKYAIARLAREFYTGDLASPPPDLPDTTTSVSVPVLYRYPSEELGDVARRILNQSIHKPDHLIGVITPNDSIRKRYWHALEQAASENPPQNRTLRIETFHKGYHPNVRFDDGGILVINVQACKGLEFDIVICADIDDHIVNPEDTDTVKKRFYVMVARARKKLIMLIRKDSNSRIKTILPRDPSILRREDL